MKSLFVPLLLVATILSGCLSDGNGNDNEPGPEPEPAPSSVVQQNGDAVNMNVPVPVFLIGFDDGTASALAQRLDPMSMASSFAMQPTAVFEVIRPDAQWQANFDAFIEEATHPGNGALTGFSGRILDGNAIEARLAQTLEQIAPVPDGITSLVIMDTGSRGHAYNYAGDVGWREPVRLFGEREAMVVWDPFAAVDPWVGEGLPHHVPVSQTSAEHLAHWVERATAIRALHMPIWPPTTATCHAITVVLAVRSTSVTPDALGLQSWDEALDMQKLQSTFANLTDDTVHVDLVVKHLPVDDAPLDLITRENSARAITQTYLDTNFGAYHVAHDGCEPYLSLVVFGDLVDQRTQSNGNAVMMGASGNRISTSLVAENVRIMSEVVGYNQQWDESTTFERVGPGANAYEWFNWVVAHETGHLFSLPHPNYSTGEQSYSDPGFASTWNVMGYQMRRIVTETSAVDSNNFARNQAALAFVESAEVSQEALQALSEYRWKDATRLMVDG